MKIARGILSLALLASALVGIQILVNDRWLWSAAPSHAYGLIGFVAVNVILAVAVLRIGFASMAAAMMAAVQFGAMLADIVAGQPDGVPSVAFRSYLLSDVSYLGLLAIQIAILSVAIGTLTTRLAHSHGHWTQFLRHQRR